MDRNAPFTPEPLEEACSWTGDEVADPGVYTEVLRPDEIKELERAVESAAQTSRDLLRLTPSDFPLPLLGERLKRVEAELMDGRGFVVIRGLPRAAWNNDQMILAYWGIGLHLGRPWPQNAQGHVLGDVTDQGRQPGDPRARGNELGQIALDYHCDGSDLVGLLCLQTGISGGRSAVANAVALHNELVRVRPDLAAELYRPQPFDYRGEQASGGRAWYPMPVFTREGSRLFVRLIRPYILASQRHGDAPRLTDAAVDALAWLQDAADSGRFATLMDFQPGDMQFINNYHVLHGRTAYQDDPSTGRVRHLKRLWLETGYLKDRPPHFTNRMGSHWADRTSVSRLDALGTQSP